MRRPQGRGARPQIMLRGLSIGSGDCYIRLADSRFAGKLSVLTRGGAAR